MHVNVLIIGGGISGLTLAYKCIKSGYNVIIFEKTDRLGGKINSIYHSRTSINISHHKLMNLLKELDISLAPAPASILTPEQEPNNIIGPGLPGLPGHGLPGLPGPGLQAVFKFAKTLSDDKLKSISFNQLCTTVFGNFKFPKVTEESAYDVINKNNDNYLYLKKSEGFQELINKLRSAILFSGKAKIMMESQITGFINKSSYIQIKIKSKNGMHIYKGDVLVSTISKNSLLSINKWKPEELSLINSVDLISMYHINSHFDNHLIKQYKSYYFHGLSMISYRNNLPSYINKNDKELRKFIIENSQVVFPEIQKFHKPKPKWTRNQGIHIWKNDVDSEKIIENIRQIYGEKCAFFIIGDTYNNNQGWIEGALESIDDIFPKITEIVTK